MADNYFEGAIIWASDIQRGTSSKGTEWARQEYVVEEERGAFPRKMLFTVFGEDKIRRFNISLKDRVKVHFDINARESNGKFYNSITAWNVESLPPISPLPANIS
jgi:hypothetical protein